ncbi:MAG: hypothetical protein ACK443_01320 [Methylococcaceae bacterium]|jgi:hypothetical protein
MKMAALLTLIGWLILRTGPIRAETVFRCIDNGRTAFTERASGPNCEALNLRAPQPNPDDAARQKEALRQWSEDRETAADNQRRTRKSGSSRSRSDPPRDMLDNSRSVLSLPPELDFKSPQDSAKSE